jgi:hypothetical protein
VWAGLFHGRLKKAGAVSAPVLSLAQSFGVANPQAAIGPSEYGHSLIMYLQIK